MVITGRVINKSCFCCTRLSQLDVSIIKKEGRARNLFNYTFRFNKGSKASTVYLSTLGYTTASSSCHHMASECPLSRACDMSAASCRSVVSETEQTRDKARKCQDIII